MHRNDLEHLIRAAGEVTNEYEFIIVGSQSILGPIPNPPAEFTMSAEADMYPRHAESKADAIEGALGEGSLFHETHGYYAQGVGPETACLPLGWEARLTAIQNAATNLKIGYCLDVTDLFLAKAVAHREKDREFNLALLRHRYVDAAQALARVADLPLDEARRNLVIQRIRRMARAATDPDSAA